MWWVQRRRSLDTVLWLILTRGRGRTEAQIQSLQSPLIQCSREKAIGYRIDWR